MKSVIIIGGATKCGTTSLFKYLSDHPDVIGSSRKETRFFLEPSYPVPSQLRYLRDGLDTYWSFFRRVDSGSHLLEATPDYLYSESAARDLWASFGGRLRVVFILRDPEARLGSWYRFAKRNGLIPEGTTYSEYFSMQVPEPQIDTPQYLRALEQGRYDHYLRAFARFVPPAHIYCLSFRELSRDPGAAVRKLTEWLGLDTGFYANYVFTVENKTAALRWPALHRKYMRATRWLRDRLLDHQDLHVFLRRLKLRIEPLYFGLNEKKRGEEEDLTPADKKKIVSYYSGEIDLLARLPWGPCSQWLKGGG